MLFRTYEIGEIVVSGGYRYRLIDATWIRAAGLPLQPGFIGRRMDPLRNDDDPRLVPEFIGWHAHQIEESRA